jgi:NAD(P)H dehydrogenase (quinone)
VAGDGPPNDVSLEAARYEARRVVDTAAELKGDRTA